MDTTTLQPTSEMLDRVPDEVVALVFSHLPLQFHLRSTSMVCKKWATLTEGCFESVCKKRGWSMPRRPRGDNARQRLFPWRSLY
mmetsp:Transcript_16052/g.34710  ORF Transcript_16052/g.34710 Transcript_16052/m.34710 type:complete len:84 (-) Transcript_16052:13-264(-)